MKVRSKTTYAWRGKISQRRIYNEKNNNKKVGLEESQVKLLNITMLKKNILFTIPT